MNITQSFPLKCCDKCKSIRPYISTQRLYGDAEIVSLEIIVGCEHEQECEAIYKMLKEQPEIVRCKDCIHWDKGHTEECGNPDSVCFHNGLCKPDWFCADAESKGGEQDG